MWLLKIKTCYNKIGYFHKICNIFHRETLLFEIYKNNGKDSKDIIYNLVNTIIDSDGEVNVILSDIV